MHINHWIVIIGLVLSSFIFAGQWNDLLPNPSLTPSQQGVMISDKDGHWDADRAIDLSEFARAGSDDAAIANTQNRAEQNARAIRYNGRRIDDTSSRLDHYSADIARNSDAIAVNRSDINRLDQRVDDVDRRLSRSIAMLAALDFQRPAPGKTIRVGLGSGIYDDRASLGVGVTAVAGQFDMSLGVAMSDNETMGKASLGLSF